jgi:hypothetical protein
LLLFRAFSIAFDTVGKLSLQKRALIFVPPAFFYTTTAAPVPPPQNVVKRMVHY